MRNLADNISNRLLSVLASLVFSVPTTALLWIGFAKQVAIIGDGGAVSIGVLWGMVVGESVSP